MSEAPERIWTDFGKEWFGTTISIAPFDRGTEYVRADARTSPDVEKLREAASPLKEIVEGIRGTMEHGTWRDERGVRLKDTPEWVRFYAALAATASTDGGEG